MAFWDEHPEAWEFFKEQARNIMDYSEVNNNGKWSYRIPVPDMSGNFIYARKDITELIHPFLMAWYRPHKDSHSMYGKTQYIVETFKH